MQNEGTLVKICNHIFGKKSNILPWSFVRVIYPILTFAKDSYKMYQEALLNVSHTTGEGCEMLHQGGGRF